MMTPQIHHFHKSITSHRFYLFTMKFRSSLLAAVLVGSAAAFAPSSNSIPSSATALNLAVGETAPDFALQDQNGKTVKRSSIKKPLVVYFYPADSTPGCTTQAKSFNEQVRDIRKTYGAEVVGISGQDVASKQAFAKELGLDFSILADEDDAVRKAFKVPKAAFGLFPGRVTYVLDKNGVCTNVYDELADAASHVEVAKGALEEIGATSGPLGSIFGR
jgi:peroxiredoxin Q/BCP